MSNKFGYQIMMELLQSHTKPSNWYSTKNILFCKAWLIIKSLEEVPNDPPSENTCQDEMRQLDTEGRPCFPIIYWF